MPTERLRLFICHTCESVQPIPWYEGPQDRDDTLNFRVAEHEGHLGNLADIEESTWNNLPKRPEILKEIAGIVTRPGAASGLGASYYDLKSTFDDDAMTCWKRHNRTTDCGDYKTDRMLLRAPTKGERKELGMDVKERPTTHLCDFCPMKSIKMQRSRDGKFYDFKG
jgi:hypothetical protein